MSARNSTCFVRELVRHLVDGGVGEGNSGVLGLETVDQVAEDPAASARAEAVPRLLAEAAAAARCDAGDEHAVALGGERRDSVSDGDDGADRLVPQDACRASTSGTSPLRMCRSVPQIVDVSMRTIASVGALRNCGSGTVSQLRSPGPW